MKYELAKFILERFYLLPDGFDQLESEPGNIIWSVVFYIFYFRNPNLLNHYFTLAKRNDYHPNVIKLTDEQLNQETRQRKHKRRIDCIRELILKLYDIEYLGMGVEIE